MASIPQTTQPKKTRQQHADLITAVATLPAAPLTAMENLRAHGERNQAIHRQRVAQICMAWQKGVESIIETGRLLIAAKAEIPHGAFEVMIKGELPFSARTAERLMAVASNRILSNPTHVSHLPPSWGTLYELTKFDDAVLLKKIEAGEITPKIERQDVAVMISSAAPVAAMTGSTSKPEEKKAGAVTVDAAYKTVKGAEQKATGAAKDDPAAARINAEHRLVVAAEASAREHERNTISLWCRQKLLAMPMEKRIAAFRELMHECHITPESLSIPGGRT